MVHTLYPAPASPLPFQNFTVKSFKQDIKVGEKLLKAVCYKIIELKYKTNRICLT